MAISKPLSIYRRNVTPPKILVDALGGLYSDFSSTLATPVMELVKHFNNAAIEDPAYQSLSQKAMQGEYDHDRGARSKSNNQPVDAAGFSRETIEGFVNNNIFSNNLSREANKPGNTEAEPSTPF
jgi:hypothetical protein